jgi:transcriptional regulator GlxA family with amidase domain
MADLIFETSHASGMRDCTETTDARCSRDADGLPPDTGPLGCHRISGRRRRVEKQGPLPGSSAAPLSVGFLVLRDFTLTPLATFIDALRLAADEGDRGRQINCSWSLIGPSLAPVRASCGIEISPQETFPDPARFTHIAVVGGLLKKGDLVADDPTVAYLRRAAAAKVPLIGLCSGTFALIEAGLMKGRRCCIDAYHYLDLIERYDDVIPVPDQLFVVDRDRITSPGGVSAADVAAYLIERHCGPAWAQKSMHLLVLDHARPPNAPQPQPPLCVSVENNRLKRAIALIEQSLGDPFSINELAQRVHLSVRQLERLFSEQVGVSPLAFYRQTRLRYGLWLLQNTNRKVTDIAHDCGFHDSAHFCRQFRALFGTSPQLARRQPAEWRGLDTAPAAWSRVPQRPELNLHTLTPAAPAA